MRCPRIPIRWKSSFLKKLFLSYVFLLLPTFTVFVLCTSSMFAVQRQTVETSVQTELEQVTAQFKTQIQAFELQSIYLSLKEDIVGEKVLANGSSAIGIIERLRDIVNSNQQVADVIISYGTGDVYASGGMSRLENYAGIQILPSERIAFEEIINDMESRAISLVAAAKNQAYVLYHVFVPGFNSIYSLSINFLMDLQSFSDYLTVLSDGYQRRLALEFPDGRVALFEEKSDEYSLMVTDDPQRTWRTAKGLTVLTSQQSCMNVNFCASYREDLLFQGVTRQWRAVLIVLAGLLLVAMVTAFEISKRNSSSIVQLAQTARSFVQAGQERDTQEDELAQIRRMIEATMEENERMRLTVADARNRLAEQVVLLLLHGVVKSRTLLEEALQASGRELHESSAAVLILAAETPEQCGAEYLNRLAQLPECGLSCRVSVPDGEALAVLLDVANPDPSGQQRREVCRRIDRGCDQAGLPRPVLCVSRVCEQLEQVSQAYIEATFAYRSKRNSGYGRVLFFDELLSFDMPILSFEPETLIQLDQAMKARDRRKVTMLLNGMLNEVDACGEHTRMQVAMRYSILQSVLHSLMEMGIERQYFTDICAMNPADGNQFPRQMEWLIRAICPDSASESDEAFQRVVRYIEENSMDQNLSLEQVAEHTGMSKEKISRAFRNRMGQKYIDYLSGLRMRQAERLLRETDLQIQEITRRVGYWDGVSFQKKFKATFGVNPSEYRNANAEKRKEV